MKLEKRRIGRFKISDELITQDFHEVLPLMAKMCVVRCEHIFPFHFQYTALSDLFEETEPDSEIPQYSITVRKKEDGTLSFEAVKA